MKISETVNHQTGVFALFFNLDLPLVSFKNVLLKRCKPTWLDVYLLDSKLVFLIPKECPFLESLLVKVYTLPAHFITGP